MFAKLSGLLAMVSAAGFSAGCLERKETIRVTADGAVHIEIEYSGEPQQFETADALPAEQAGWPVRRQVKKKADGKEEIILAGGRSFAPREALPDNFSADGDPDADLYTSFPTGVTMERRSDGLYMHFRRTYLPRAWAFVQYWQDQFIDDDIEKRAETPVEEMSHEDRVRIMKAFAGFEAFKQIELSMAALNGMDMKVAQDVRLRARQATVDLLERTDWDAMVERVAGLPENERDQGYEVESKRFLDHTYRSFVDELAIASDWRGDQRERFEDAFVRARKVFQITNEVGGHAFHIRVFMPGEIVAHNGELKDDGSVEWEFSGDAFRDRAHELMVTAKLPGGNHDRH